MPSAPWIEYSTAKVESKVSLTDHQAYLLQPMIAGYALNNKGWSKSNSVLLCCFAIIDKPNSEISIEANMDLGILNVEHLSESTFRSTAMNNLVLDERTRNIIQAVCHEQSQSWKIDYVQGKGEGQTVLLHGRFARSLYRSSLTALGPPGVGKTYTVGL